MASPVPTVDLTTLAAAKAYFTAGGLTLPPDDTLQLLITAVSSQIQSYLSRRLPSQSYAVTLDGRGGDRISLPNTPITAVASLQVDGLAVSASSTPFQPGFAFSETQVYYRGGGFSRGLQNVALTYTGGYAVIPQDIVAACWEGLSAVAQAMPRDPSVRSEKAGDTAYVYGGTDVEAVAGLCLTANITSILNQYRRVAPC